MNERGYAEEDGKENRSAHRRVIIVKIKCGHCEKAVPFSTDGKRVWGMRKNSMTVYLKDRRANYMY